MRWIWDWAIYHNSHSSKSIRVTKLSFGQNDLPRSTPFWQKNSLGALKLFELWLLWYLAQSQIHRITLYYKHLKNGQLVHQVNAKILDNIAIYISTLDFQFNLEGIFNPNLRKWKKWPMQRLKILLQLQSIETAKR